MLSASSIQPFTKQSATYNVQGTGGEPRFIPVMAMCPNGTHLPDKNCSLVPEVSRWQSHLLYELYHAS
jgi:hypothetical protein